MFYCFVDPDQVRDGRILIQGDDARHLRKVLRAGPGEKVRVRSDRFLYTGSVERTGPEGVTLRVLDSEEVRTGGRKRIYLAPAVIQEKNFDIMLRFAVQLGISGVFPLAADRAANHNIKKDRTARWNRIVRESCMQCRRPDVPEVAPPVTLPALLDRFRAMENCGMVMPDELEGSRRLSGKDLDRFQTLALFIGPEGGWSYAERDAAVKAGALRVSLGKLVLRAETAALVGLTILQKELGYL